MASSARMAWLVILPLLGFAAGSEGQVSVGWPLAYNKTLTEFFAHLAQVSFCDDTAIEHWSCGAPCEHSFKPTAVKFVAPGNHYKVQGYVAVAPDSERNIPANGRTRCISAFRGSSNWQNWVADGLLAPAPYPEAWCKACRVHSGFQRAYAELQKTVISAVKDLKCQDLYFVGHSLGAAIALLAMGDFRANGANRGINVGPAFLFGAPSVGNKAYIKALDRFTSSSNLPGAYLFANELDPVPHLSSLAYARYGIEVFIKVDKSVVVCSKVGDKRCSDGVSTTTVLRKFKPANHCLYFDVNFEGKTLPHACRAKNPEALLGGAAQVEVLV